MHRKIRAGFTVLGLLAGCSSTGESQAERGGVDTNGAIETSVEVAGDRVYQCFRYTTVYRGGLSCEPVSPDTTRNHEQDISVSTELSADGFRIYDCFTYTKESRGGIDCILVGHNNGEVAIDPNDTVRISVENGIGFTADCFTYTTVKRGGLVCVTVV